MFLLRLDYTVAARRGPSTRNRGNFSTIFCYGFGTISDAVLLRTNITSIFRKISFGMRYIEIPTRNYSRKAYGDVNLSRSMRASP